ncbi:flagellar hook-associated protein FlgK [Massilia arenosa]|uniref:Flagellar hook-associated protein 1 n=1 Tax=Zemynaea arenosa TaxID=2561931 RepID=A0A4Y9SX36_9BURK|nr:flagellar hook-associated protein FlgK [Massilia arenosa]TFW29909.1 flagellar hook-associated protein FlgK [Massilia arenosa]
MAGNILSIGKSGLFAAQVGLSTTGHNITNANVAGYSRQVVVQQSSAAQDMGYGFVGSGTQVAQIKRYSDEFLNAQVRTAQSSKSALDAFQSQIAQIDNLMADTTSGLSPALQDFFNGVQDVASNPQSAASRQSLLSAADSLAARFQGMNQRLQEIREGVNTEITTNVTLINSYAQRIADLNDKIGAYTNSDNQPNDLLDQRDQLIAELNKQVKATVVAGDNNSLTVSIGSGQPLVVGKKAFELAVTTSPTDPTRVEVGYRTGDKVTLLGDNALSGGALGGLLQFRTESLDRVQNSLGRIAVSLAFSFNEQHKLGQDLASNMGGDFFTVAPAFVGRNANNSIASTADVSATIVDPGALTQSDYKLTYDGSNYMLVRLSDNHPTLITMPQTTGPQVVDGMAIAITGNGVVGDNFSIKPTIQGASQFKVAITDRDKIAAAAPVVSDVPTANKGNLAVGGITIDSTYPAAPLGTSVTFTYDKASNTFSTNPAVDVTVTSNGVPTVYTAGTPIPYATGDEVSFNSMSFKLTGQPNDTDTFKIAPNTAGVGDNRNMRLLGALQTKNILDGGSATFQSSYAEMVSYVGNKTREVQVNADAAEGLLQQATASQQSVSGVNLDEEATNLLKYQQAYQAAGKVMQIAGTLFDTLLSIGR